MPCPIWRIWRWIPAESEMISTILPPMFCNATLLRLSEYTKLFGQRAINFFSNQISLLFYLQRQFGSQVRGCSICRTLICLWQLWNSLDVNALIVKTFQTIFVVCLQKGIIIHEMGHAIGFQHEQTRPDRNAFVTINSANIQSGVEYNFRQYSTNQVGTFNIPYDYSSVMHYSQYVSNYIGIACKSYRPDEQIT